ncbi:hypothetical protein CR513_29613, partial [Mucuna pruriens]
MVDKPYLVVVIPTCLGNFHANMVDIRYFCRNRRALILGWVYDLNAFSTYPLCTWLPNVYHGHDNWHIKGASFSVLSY